MLQGQALKLVLKMAQFFPHQGELEKKAIEEVEALLTQFEDTGNYTEDDYMED